ncbi:MAG: polysaccharide deacetylase family protein [Omnitrophica bacterium]|nr:polysaccharide deacetylase family protein [Candidatus Omnitrophota bacterium]
MRKSGYLTIAFDDAYLDTYKHAIHYLNKLNIKSTIAVAAGLIGKKLEKRPIIGFRECRMLLRSGHEIASHTLTHPNLLRIDKAGEDRAKFEIIDSKRVLEKKLSCKISSFVFPYIAQNESPALRKTAGAVYKSMRLTSDRPVFNRIPVKNPRKITGFAIMRKHSAAYLKKHIDYVEKENRWLIEVFHLVSDKNTKSAHRPKPYRFFMHIDDFKKHVDYILSKNIMILTQRDALKL